MNKSVTIQLPEVDTEELPPLGNRHEKKHLKSRKHIVGTREETGEEVKINIGDVIANKFTDEIGFSLVIEIGDPEYILWDLQKEEYTTCKRSYLLGKINDSYYEVEIIDNPYDLRETT